MIISEEIYMSRMRGRIMEEERSSLAIRNLVSNGMNL
jgi:hypothetical protein